MILSTAHKVLNPTAPHLEIPSPQYSALRSTLVRAELLLLRILRFELRIPLPFEFLGRYLDRAVASWDAGGFDRWEDDEREEDAVVGEWETGLGKAVREWCVKILGVKSVGGVFPARAIGLVAVRLGCIDRRALRLVDVDVGEGAEEKGREMRDWVDRVGGEKVDLRDFEDILGELERAGVWRSGR